jgi:WD40 repeat protein
MIQEVPLQAYISALAFSPSNSVIRRAYTDELPQWLTRLLQTPKDWDQEWLSLEGHRDWVGVLAFLPDDLLLASGSRDNTVKLWDITTGAAGGTLEGHTDSVLALTFSPDGQLLASASSNESIRLWRAKSGAACGILEGHSDDIGALAFTPDSLLLASASDDTTIRLWSPAMVEARGTLIGHTDKVKCAIFMPDGSYLLSTGLDATVKVWNVETMSIIRTVKLSVAETVMARFNQHGEIVFSPNCQLLAVKSEDNLIGLWNITTGAAILVYAELDLYRFSLVFSPYSRFITSSTGQNSHEIWDVQTQKRDVVPNGVRAVSVAFSIDGQFLALGSDTGIISLLIFNSMPANEDYNDQPRYISTIAFSSDGSQLVSGSSSGEIGLLSLLSGKEERVWLENVYDEINVVALHPDCMQIAVVSGCTLWLSHIDQGEERLITSAVLDIAFSPAGKTIATAHSNQFWATKTGAEIRTLFGHSKSVTAVTFSSGDDILASGSADKTVRLWQTYSGAQCGILKGHLDPVWRVSFSPNSKLLGSSSDNEVLIWNPRTCELLYKIHTTIDSKWLKFSADSRIITTKNTAYWLPLLLSSAPAGSASTDSYALAIMDKWLTCNMENLLWIPPQYRSDIVAIHNLTIALCCS